MEVEIEEMRWIDKVREKERKIKNKKEQGRYKTSKVQKMKKIDGKISF